MARLEFSELTTIRMWFAALIFFFIYIVALSVLMLLAKDDISSDLQSLIRTVTTGSFFLAVPSLLAAVGIYYAAELGLKDTTVRTSVKLSGGKSRSRPVLQEEGDDDSDSDSDDE